MKASSTPRSRHNNVGEAIALGARDQRDFVHASGIAIRGYCIKAPGFSTEDFDTAIDRALDEGVLLEATSQLRTFRARRSGSPTIYTVTPTGCTCRAGEVGRPCEYLALALLVLAITGPRPP